MNKVSLSVIILTYNEEKNIGRCLASVQKLAREIFIVDSGSSDRTVEIAARYTDRIYRHAFESHSAQVNWAIENLPVGTEWVMRLDADEAVSDELAEEMRSRLPGAHGNVNALYVKRRVYFMGRWIKHGGYYPAWLLRIWRNGRARCEECRMDEHMKIAEGEARFLAGDIVEENRKGLHWWIAKHNSYATKEARDILDLRRANSPKERFYAKLPLFVRSFLYFVYRYIFRLGLLDGTPGLVWHFLQGLWYRFLVDAKIYEARKRRGPDAAKVKKFFDDNTGNKLIPSGFVGSDNR